jgi:hypothetical protein
MPGPKARCPRQKSILCHQGEFQDVWIIGDKQVTASVERQPERLGQARGKRALAPVWSNFIDYAIYEIRDEQVAG